MALKAPLFLGTCLILNSCCMTIKEEYLGNNIYLSEYDNIDRRILYSEEECTGSGIEMVPMTVTAFDFNDKWIIAKSMSYRNKSNVQYWIIKNDFLNTPSADLIKANMIGPIDSTTFESNLKEKGIDLALKDIEQMSEQGLVKIHIDLPNHWAIGGESMWAEPLGDDLYKIENVPFYAYGLNFHDIVRATSDSNELKPEIRELVESSGHRTFRVFFEKHIERDQQEVILNSMKDLTISYERANSIYFALDMQPDGNYQAVFNRLEELEQQNFLGFETCEARVDGSFDDVPGENE